MKDNGFFFLSLFLFLVVEKGKKRKKGDPILDYSRESRWREKPCHFLIFLNAMAREWKDKG